MNNALSVLENELIRLNELMEKCLVECIKTNKKLKIAVEALKDIRKNYRHCDTNHSDTADDALIEIEEIENESNQTNS